MKVSSAAALLGSLGLMIDCKLNTIGPWKSNRELDPTEQLHRLTLICAGNTLVREILQSGEEQNIIKEAL